MDVDVVTVSKFQNDWLWMVACWADGVEMTQDIH